VTDIGRVYGGGSAQVTLALGAFLGKDMAPICRSTLDSTGTLLFETLRRATLGLEFRHDYLCFSLAPGACRKSEDFKNPDNYFLCTS
jgi:hypothetical protein